MSLAHLLPGKTYRPVGPEDGRRIRIKSFTPGGRQATIVNAVTGKGKRWILTVHLHPTDRNSKGELWRTGYVLEEGQ